MYSNIYVIVHCCSAWTKKYQPIDIVDIIEGDVYDEDKYTIKCMKKYGIDNVRGGTYCQMKLPENLRKHIQDKISNANDTCFLCGEWGHFANNCPNAVPGSVNTTNKVTCRYCSKVFKSKKFFMKISFAK